MAEIGITSRERNNVESYRRTYENFSDGEGIPLEKLQQALDNVGIEAKNPTELKKLFDAYDKSRSNLLQEEEFLEMVTSFKSMTQTGISDEMKTKAEYRDAIRVVGSNFDNIEAMPSITRKVLRKVEVPYVREVKVPIKTKKIVPKTVIKRIPVTRLERREGVKLIEEEYIAIEKQLRTRMKTVVTEKQVPEEFWEDVEFTRTRMVEVPDVQFVSVDGFDEVDVVENQLVEVDGYRLDQVEDVKYVEVWEEEDIEFVPRETGRTRVIERREVGTVDGDHLTRVMGRIVYGDEDLDRYELDNRPDNYQHIRYHTPNPLDKSRTLYKRADIDNGVARLNFMHSNRHINTRLVGDKYLYGRETTNGRWENGRWEGRKWVEGEFEASEADRRFHVGAENGSSSSSSRSGGSTTTRTTTTTTRTTSQKRAGATEEVLGAAGGDDESESL